MPIELSEVRRSDVHVGWSAIELSLAVHQGLLHLTIVIYFHELLTSAEETVVVERLCHTQSFWDHNWVE